MQRVLARSNVVICALVVFILSPSVSAQSVTYHLHREASSTTGLDQLKMSGPDAASLALLSANLNGAAAGEYIIQGFDTQGGDPGASGTIASGSTVSFTVYMRKTASAGTMTPRAKLFLNGPTGVQFCTATGTTALSTTVTKISLSCKTSAAITIASTDRLYLWVGINLTATSNTTSFNGELDVEGTLNGNFDSQVSIPVPSASITSLSPSSGAVGALVTIAGKNFGPAQGQSTVTFTNAKTASVSSWSPTQIVAAVPTGAVTGNVTVTVGGRASNGTNFTVVPAPVISSVSPGSGTAGTTVTINGSNFGSTTPGVKFNGIAAAVSSFTSTSIMTTVPIGATTGNIVVTASGVNSNGSAFTVPAPSITSLSPSSGAPGATFTVSGSNFGSIAGSVTINGQSATTSTWSNTSITVTVPNNATTGNVVVTSGSLSSNGVAFTVAPIITALNQIRGEPGTSVTISGLNFTPTAGAVSFNGKNASISSWTMTSITAQVPNGATTGNVIVTAGSLQSNAQTFTVLAPVISSLSPSSGTAGASVTIIGSNFGVTAGTVTFNGQTAAITTWSDSSIAVTVPNGATTGNVVVSNGGLQSGGVPFTVAPIISALAPASGEPGTSITISGLNFTPTAGTVSFNGKNAAISSWTISSITAQVPNGATTGNVIVTAAGLQSNGQAFTVLGPVVSTLSPSSGAPGASVTIAGSNFGPANGTVTFNGQTAAITTWSDSSIVVTVPTGATTGNVVVSNGGLQSGGLPFTVPPIITSVSPASAEPGATVTIAGLNFTGIAGTVTFNGQAATTSNWTDTSITAVVPNGASNGNVIVTAGTLQSNAQVFTVLGPVISTLSPTSGAPGASVTIAGSNFGAAAGTVTFNGQTAATTTWSDSSIVVTVPNGAPTGNVVVSNGGLQSPGITFTVAPIITSLNPASAEPGASITIAGLNFTGVAGTLTFNGQTATTSTWTDTSITAIVPSGVTNGNVIVTAGAFQSNGQSFTVLAPTISSFTPSSAVAGSSVTIGGSNFGATAGTVTFNGLTATVTTWSDNSIVVTVPTGATTGNVVVSNGGLQSGGVVFSVLFPPVINAITPTSGNAGITVTISGSNFGAAPGTVSFNGSSAAISSWSDTSIAAVVPASATSGGVVVTAPGGQSNAIVFDLNPIIASVSPTSGPPGTLIRITGSNFGGFQGAGQVQIGQLLMPVSSWSDTLIVATIPADAITGNIVLATDGFLISNSVNFTVDHGGPLLQLSISDTPLQVNLTSPQIVDWIHWGRISLSVPDRKDGIAPLISDYVPFNGAQAAVSSGNIAFSWSDGNHPAVVSEANEDIETFTSGSGFTITVPADTAAKTLNLYAEVFAGQAVLQATLSDSSAPDVVDQSVTDSDVGSKVYSIDFRAATPGQTLTVTLSIAPTSFGGVGLQAATLTPHLPVVSIASPIAGQAFSANSLVAVSVNANQLDSTITDVKAVGSDATVLETTSSPLNANWGPLAGGHYSLNASATDTTALSGTATPVEFDVIGQGGTLSIVEDVPVTPANLDTLGSGDWVLWGPLNTGDSIVDNPGHIMARKAGVAPLISQYKPIGNHFINSQAFGHSLCFTGDQQSYCSGSELTVHGVGSGFEITAPADTNARTLQLYVGFLSADATVTAFLSDGSAPVATEIGGTGPPTSTTTLYNINYSAASAGQTLTVRLTLNTDQGGGQISLIGAALNGSSLPQVAPVPQITGITPNPAAANTKVTVAGTNFGSVEGQGSVYFGGVAANVVNWSDTSIDVVVPGALEPGNTVQVAVITAGGTSNLVNFSTPIYKITPQNIAMIVGQSRTVSATDASGNVVKGLAWKTDDLGIVSLSTDDPAVITALAPGNATVWAGDVSFPITVYAPDAIPPGTPLWRVPVGSGTGNVSIAPAVPSDNGADVFALDDSGTLTAFTSDGTPVWKVSGIPGGSTATIIPDFAGNALLKTPYTFTDAQGNIQSTKKIQKADQTSQQLSDLYTYSAVQTDAKSFSDPSAASQAAIPDTTGMLFVLDNATVSIIDPSGVKPTVTVNIDKSSFNGSPQPPSIGSMIVAGDGNSYTPYVYSEKTETTGADTSTTTHNVEHLMLLRASPDGSSAKIELRAWTSDSTCSPWTPPGHTTADGTQCTSNGPTPTATNVSVITNADQGAAIFATTVLVGCSSSFFSQGQLVSESGCGDTLAHTELDYVSQDVITSQIPDAVVLPNDTGRQEAFVPVLQREDGSYIGIDTNSVVNGFSNLLAVGTAGGTLWSKAVSSAPTFITPLYATADGGVIVQSKQVQNCQSNPPHCDTIGAPQQYTLDQNGNITAQRGDPGASMSWTGEWYAASVPMLITEDRDGVYSWMDENYSLNLGFPWITDEDTRAFYYWMPQSVGSSSDASVSSLAFAPVEVNALGGFGGGNPSKTGAAARPWYFKVAFQNDFFFYPAYPDPLSPDLLLITDLSDKTAVIKDFALQELKDAYSGFPVIVSEGAPGTGDDWLIVRNVLDTTTDPACGDTPTGPNWINPIGDTVHGRYRFSEVAYQFTMAEAQGVVKIVMRNRQDVANALKQTPLIQYIGHGLGATAAHEIAHHFLLDQDAMDALVNALFDSDPNAKDTFNAAGCDASINPSIYTGINLHWEPVTQTALGHCLSRGWRNLTVTSPPRGLPLCAIGAD